MASTKLLRAKVMTFEQDIFSHTSTFAGFQLNAIADVICIILFQSEVDMETRMPRAQPAAPKSAR